MILIAIIAYVFWAIIGLILWIPILVRVITAFCGSIMYNMLTHNEQTILKAKESLTLALSLYARGFETIQSALFNPRNPQTTYSSSGFGFSVFFYNVLWTTIFWTVTLYPFISEKIWGSFDSLRYSSAEILANADKDLAINDTTSAIYNYSIAIRKEPHNAVLYYTRSLLNLNKDAVGSYKDFIMAIKLDTNYGRNSNIDYRVGETLLNNEKYENAISCFTLALHYNESFSEAYFDRAYCYDELDKSDLALDDYSKGLELDSTDGNAYNNMALIYVHQGDKTKGCDFFDKAVVLGNQYAKENKAKYCK